MKKTVLIFLALSILLAACTPYMYGVPQDTWDRMSEPERIEAMRVYEQREQMRRQAAEERARQQAIAREQERVRRAEAEQARQERIEAIHRGRGAYGELIRVRLQGGTVRIGDRQYYYQPLTFTIADGESVAIDVVNRRGRDGNLTAIYADGEFSLGRTRFPYDRSWGRGRVYASIDTAGAPELHNADVFVEVHDRSTRLEREPPRLVIIREQEPPPVIIRERVEPPPVVREREPHHPLSPAVRMHEPPAPPVRPPEAPAALRPPRSIEVTLLSGEMKVRGRKQFLEKTSLRLRDGESRTLTVNIGSEQRTLSVQYSNGVLQIDGTPGRGHDGLRLGFEREWHTGKIYRTGLKGRVPLEKLEVKVTGHGP